MLTRRVLGRAHYFGALRPIWPGDSREDELTLAALGEVELLETGFGVSRRLVPHRLLNTWAHPFHGQLFHELFKVLLVLLSLLVSQFSRRIDSWPCARCVILHEAARCTWNQGGPQLAWAPRAVCHLYTIDRRNCRRSYLSGSELDASCAPFVRYGEPLLSYRT